MAKSTTKPSLTYDSNPFTLAFNSFMRMFNTNTVWAVVFLIFGILGALGQFAGNIADIATTTNDTRYEQSESTSWDSTGDRDDNYLLGDKVGEPEASSTDEVSTAAIISLVAVISVFVLLFIGIVYAVGTFVSGLFVYVAIQSEKGKTVTFSEAWDAVVKRYWRLLGAQLLAGLKIVGWTLLFIIPGIIAALRYTLLPYVVMATGEDEKGVKNTHDKTKATVKGRLWEVFGIGTVAAIIPFVGSMLQLTGNAALYSQLNYYNENQLEKPKIHWLNYLGMVLIGLMLLLIVFIGLVVLIIALANR